MTTSTDGRNIMNTEQPLLSDVTSSANLVKVDPLHSVVAAMSTDSDIEDFYDICELWPDGSGQYVHGSMSELSFMAPDQFVNSDSAAQYLGMESELLHDPWIMNQLRSKITVPVELARESQGPVQLAGTTMRPSMFSSEHYDTGSMTDVGSPGPEIAMDSAESIHPHYVSKVQRDFSNGSWIMPQVSSEVITRDPLQFEYNSFSVGQASGPKHISASQTALDSEFVIQPKTHPVFQELSKMKNPDPLEKFLHNPLEDSKFLSKPVDSFPAGCMSGPKHSSTSDSNLESGFGSQPETPSLYQVLRWNSSLDPLQQLPYNPGDCSMRFSKHVQLGSMKLVGQVSCPKHASDLQRTMSSEVAGQPKTPLVSKGSSHKRGQDKEAYDKKLIMGKRRRKDIKDRNSVLRGLIPGGERLQRIQMCNVAINYVKFLQLQVSLLTQQEHETSSFSALQSQQRGAAGAPYISEALLDELFHQQLCIGNHTSSNLED